MKKLLLSTVALIGFTSLAAAADLPARAAPPAPIAAVPVFTWSGFYVGVHGAFARNDADARLVSRSAVLAGATPASRSLYETGFGFGGQAGYNMQFGQFVAGIETDITYLDLGRTRRTTIGGVRTTLQSDMDFLGSVRGRIGIAFPSFIPLFQQSMIYVTGGLAYADTNTRGSVVSTATPATFAPLTGGTDDMRIGWVVGIGSEHAITNNVSIKTETQYYDLEDETVALRSATRRATYRFQNDGWVSRIGLNVRF